MTQAHCWIDGKLTPAADAKISVFDHGLLYGDGIFEGIRFYAQTAFRLNLHLSRLQRSAQALQISLPYSAEQLTAAIRETIIATGLADGYIRLLVTRGVGSLGINPASCRQPSVIIIADQLQMISEQSRAQGIRVITASTRRLSPDRLDSRVKSLNYLNAILARLEANNAGAEEALLLNDRGFIAEGSADNLFVVAGGRLLTPPASDGALAGVTRQTVLELAETLGISWSESHLTSYDVYNADECFLTGTGAKLIPVRELDGRLIRNCPGKIYQDLSTAFAQFIRQEIAVDKVS